MLERTGYGGQGAGATPDKGSVWEGHGQLAVDVLHPHQSPVSMDLFQQNQKTSKSTQGLQFSNSLVCGSPGVAKTTRAENLREFNLRSHDCVWLWWRRGTLDKCLIFANPFYFQLGRSP